MPIVKEKNIVQLLGELNGRKLDFIYEIETPHENLKETLEKVYKKFLELQVHTGEIYTQWQIRINGRVWLSGHQAFQRIIKLKTGEEYEIERFRKRIAKRAKV